MTKRIERMITIDAPPERVWKAWVEEMNAWWTKPYFNDHDRVTGLSMEPGIGGRYIEKWGENGEGFLIGNITEWLPPHRLSYTWSQSDWQGVNTLIRIGFKENDTGGTDMTYIHEGFERLPPELKRTSRGETMQGYDQGWVELSGRLKNFIESGSPT